MPAQENQIPVCGGGRKCETVGDGGFRSKENGELIALADKDFDVLVAIDKNIRYQQNIKGRNIDMNALGLL